MNISGLDLNLLRVFDAVYRERNATRAARRVGLSQPAVSNALSRLRAQIGDPLFQRAPEGLRPTPRADALAEPVRQALALIEEALDGPDFDPAHTQRAFRVAAVDYAIAVLLPRVARRMAAEAPRARLDVRPSIGRTLDLLDEGEIDLGLMIRSAPPERFAAEPLMRDRYVAVMRPDHPLADQPLTVEAYAGARHLLVSPTNESTGIMDAALARLGASRRVSMVIAQFALAPPLLLDSDMLLTCPSRFAALYGARFGLAVRETPFPPDGAGAVSMIWRRRFGETAALSWFRAMLRAEAAGMEIRPGAPAEGD